MFCNNAAKWVFTLAEDFEWKSGRQVNEDMAFFDKTGVRRMEIESDGTIRVIRGYSWDGCTPKFCLFDILIGVPDGAVDTTTKRPKAYYASLVHDALYQFLKDGSPYSRSQADRFFLRLMGETGFAPRYVYFLAVRLFGGLFGWFGRLLRRHSGKRVTVDLSSQPPVQSPLTD